MNNSKSYSCPPPPDTGSISNYGIHVRKNISKKLRGIDAKTHSAYVSFNHLLIFKKAAFTLAEVLITLGIIGIVAALTMPALIQKQSERETVTRLKKIYSVLSQSYISIKNEEGTPDTWYTTYDGMSGAGLLTASTVAGEKFAKYLKVNKTCIGTQGCFAEGLYGQIDGSENVRWDNSAYYKVVTADGMSIIFFSYGPNGKYIGNDYKRMYLSVVVDTNGKKKPNINGKDLFTFIVTTDSVYPVGTQNMREGFPDDCNTDKCTAYCEACTGWVIYNENMDYLHCDDLSWEGKTKCN